MKNILTKNATYFARLWSSQMAKDILKVYGGDVTSKFLGITVALFLIRGLSVYDYAAYTAFCTILYLLPGLTGGGVNRALVRYSSEYISITGEKPIELYFINLVFQIILYALFSVLFLLMADTVTNVLFGDYAFESALTFGIVAGTGYLITEAGRGVYKAEERFGNYVRTLWFRQITIFVFITFLFFTKRLHFLSSVLAITIAELLVATLITVDIFRSFKLSNIWIVVNKHSEVIKVFLFSSTWLIAYEVIVTLFSRLDILMLSHLSTKQDLAYYSVAFRFYDFGLLMLRSIHAVLLPKFSSVKMQDFAAQRQFLLTWLKLTVWIIVPILFLDIFCKPLFILLVGQDYESAFRITAILSFGLYISLMFSPMINILISRQAFRFLFILALGAFILNITGNYLLIPLFGGVGAASITVLAHAFLNITATIRILFFTT